MSPEQLIPTTLSAAIPFLFKRISYLSVAEQEIIAEAFCFCAAAHSDQRRKSGDLYTLHPLKVACFMALYSGDADNIVASLLHDVLEDTDVTADRIKLDFGPAVLFLVESVTHHNAFSNREYFEKVFQRSQNDHRVALIKLADHCVNLMHNDMAAFNAEKHAAKLEETKQFYLPRLSEVSGVPSDLQRTLVRILAQSETELARKR